MLVREHYRTITPDSTMKSRSTFAVLLVCAIALPLAYAVAFPGDDIAVSHGSWEHLALTQESDGLGDGLGSQINRLGSEGWQLICVTPFSENGTTTKTVYYFKRQK